jgi:hypothetical protein
MVSQCEGPARRRKSQHVIRTQPIVDSGINLGYTVFQCAHESLHTQGGSFLQAHPVFRKEFQIYRKAEEMLGLLIGNPRKLEFSDTVVLLKTAIRKLHIAPALLVN